MPNRVEVVLRQDRALVLFEMLSRFQGTNQLRVRSNAEFLGLSEVTAQLEHTLVQPLQPNCRVLLGEAQARVAAGFEGLAPGVEP